MGDKTVFQQQARMQSAQIEQNQALMAQNAQQIAMMEKSQNEADEAKRVANELFEAGRRTKKIKKLFDNHKEVGFVLCLSEQIRWTENGLNGTALADISSKERLETLETQIDELLEDDSNEPDDLDEILAALLEARGFTKAIGGHDVDNLEQAKEKWSIQTVENTIETHNLHIKGIFFDWFSILGSIGVIALSLWINFLAFLIPLWFGFLALAFVVQTTRKYLDVTSTKKQVKNQLETYKVNCQRYRDWKSGGTGIGYLEDYFSDSSVAYKLVMEHYTL
jgi:hypothetical protein